MEHYQCLLETVGWFFFNLLLLGYVEDRTSGASFCIPSGLEWSVYAEVSIIMLGTYRLPAYDDVKLYWWSLAFCITLLVHLSYARSKFASSNLYPPLHLNLLSFSSVIIWSCIFSRFVAGI